jgi:hypothetical protein
MLIIIIIIEIKICKGSIRMGPHLNGWTPGIFFDMEQCMEEHKYSPKSFFGENLRRDFFTLLG